jgi:hypothetical protein
MTPKQTAIAIKEASKAQGYANWLTYSRHQKRVAIAIKTGQPAPEQPVIVGHIQKPF